MLFGHSRKKLPGTDLTLFVDISQGTVRPIVPECLRLRVFQSLHSLAHPGVLKSKKLIAERFCWPGMNADIRRFVSACDPCGRVKVGRHNAAPLEQFPVIEKRFKFCHLDLVGPLPPSVLLGIEYKYLLTIIDRHSRWVEAVPLVDITSEAVIAAFLSQWVSRFGAPAIILTDRGSQFKSRAFAGVTQYLGIQHRFTAAYSPKCDGILETWHRVVKNALKCYLDRTSWVQYLPFVLLGIRSSVDIHSGVSPAEQLYGQHLRLPCQFFDIDMPGFDESESTEQIRAIGNYLRSREGIYPRYRENRAYLDPRLRTTRFVYVRKGKKENLKPVYKGPYLVLEKHPKYFKLLLASDREDNVSIDRLKSCTAYPFNSAPVDVDLIFQGPPLQIEEEVVEETDEQETDNEIETPDILDQHPNLLRDFFEGIEEVDPLDRGIRTRYGRRIRYPRALRDYQL